MHGSKFLWLDMPTNRSKEMILTAVLLRTWKWLDVTDLLYGTVILFNMPVSVMLLDERFSVNGSKVGYHRPKRRCNCAVGLLIKSEITSRVRIF